MSVRLTGVRPIGTNLVAVYTVGRTSCGHASHGRET